MPLWSYFILELHLTQLYESLLTPHLTHELSHQSCHVSICAASRIRNRGVSAA